ncbi:hypothetical protein [Breoghania sp.]|uniref:hypothetical protein n=1 Tax=Breoghania sp. TaxID=2065378 RepID=UPI00261F7207|nr:hypothetical protein [Breoghania sp.]MDJ0930121.1 hypothetical protein [Breoghania sp.]
MAERTGLVGHISGGSSGGDGDIPVRQQVVDGGERCDRVVLGMDELGDEKGQDRQEKGEAHRDIRLRQYVATVEDGGWWEQGEERETGRLRRRLLRWIPGLAMRRCRRPPGMRREE